MKKVLIPLSLGLLVFASCKKDYTCECTHTRTETYQGTSEVTTGTSVTTYKNVTKKAVQDELDCYSNGNKYSYGSTDDLTTVDNQSECEIKK